MKISGSAHVVKQADNRNLPDMPLNVHHSWGTTYHSVLEMKMICFFSDDI